MIRPLIDTVCLQTNIINTRVADMLNKDGGTLYKTDIILTAGVGGQSYGVQGIMNLTIMLTNNDEDQTLRHIFLRAIVCRDVVTDSIFDIDLPSIMYFDLLPFFKVTCLAIRPVRCVQYNHSTRNLIVPSHRYMHQQT